MFKVKIVALFSPKGIFVLLIKDVVANKGNKSYNLLIDIRP